MGGSTNLPAYDPVTDPYGSSINVPDLATQEAGANNSIAQQFANTREQTRAATQAQGVGGVEGQNALNQVAANQNQAQLQSNAQLQQQDFQNRLGELQAINGPLYQQANLGTQQAQYGQQQQQQQTSSAIGGGLALVSLLSMLA
jgi:hypothetical protein